MHTSEEGIALLRHFEGCKLNAYQDSVGVWTIGYGHTKGVERGMKISQEEAESMLQQELEHEYEDYISDIDQELTQCQFDALVCWVYNLGPTNLRSSTMLKEIIAGNMDLVPFQMKRWDKAGGKVLLGLTRRRNAEALLFKGENWQDYKDVEA